MNLYSFCLQGTDRLWDKSYLTDNQIYNWICDKCYKIKIMRYLLSRVICYIGPYNKATSSLRRGWVARGS